MKIICKQYEMWDNKNNSHLLEELLSMPITVNLATLKPGESAIIAAVHTDRALSYRLAALGFRVGKRIELIRQARFSGPLHVRIGATDIMLRKREALQIEVQPPSSLQ